MAKEHMDELKVELVFVEILAGTRKALANINKNIDEQFLA
jgi:hypothetical protein